MNRQHRREFDTNEMFVAGYRSVANPASRRIALRSLASIASQSSSKETASQRYSNTGAKDGKHIVSALAALAGVFSIGTLSVMLEKAPEVDETTTESKGKYQKRPKQKYNPPTPPPLPPPEYSELNDPPLRPDLPIIPLKEVKDHNDEDSLWLTFRGAVYDMTFFQHGHPGGAPRLLMAAGQDLEPYWDVYRQHLRGHIVQWMEKHRIGTLSQEDRAKQDANKVNFGDIYQSDPIRDPNCLPCTVKPFAGEPRVDLMTQDYYTPNELFFVRNHSAVPDIDPDDYVLIVKGKSITEHKFTLEDLKTKFPKHKVTTTMQCAGNRREDMHSDHNIFMAPHWVAGAVSTGKPLCIVETSLFRCHVCLVG